MVNTLDVWFSTAATDAFIEDCLTREGCPLGPSAAEAEAPTMEPAPVQLEPEPTK